MAKTLKTLVVDLDGTLLRGDMLYESFRSALGQNRIILFSSFMAALRGRASLKRHLAEVSAVDVAALPYDEMVIAYIRKWRKGGGQVALVTASDDGFAKAIAKHLGLFDEAHGSDGKVNLKSNEKANFCLKRFGSFAYMGDSTADLPVWKNAAKAITINASSGLRRKVENISPDTEHLTGEEK